MQVYAENLELSIRKIALSAKIRSLLFCEWVWWFHTYSHVLSLLYLDSNLFHQWIVLSKFFTVIYNIELYIYTWAITIVQSPIKWSIIFRSGIKYSGLAGADMFCEGILEKYGKTFISPVLYWLLWSHWLVRAGKTINEGNCTNKTIAIACLAFSS